MPLDFLRPGAQDSGTDATATAQTMRQSLIASPFIR
jgi:hypothetical protein